MLAAGFDSMAIKGRKRRLRADPIQPVPVIDVQPDTSAVGSKGQFAKAQPTCNRNAATRQGQGMVSC